jgi:hypothetical protein
LLLILLKKRHIFQEFFNIRGFVNSSTVARSGAKLKGSTFSGAAFLSSLTSRRFSYFKNTSSVSQ